MKDGEGRIVLLIILVATLVAFLSGCTTPPPEDLWDGVFPSVEIGGGIEFKTGVVLRNRRGEKYGVESDAGAGFKLGF